MRYSLKITLLIFLVCFCSIGAYVFGYFQGYLGGLGHPAMANALGTVNALNAIRQERKQDAIDSLELRLDTEIIMSANYESSYFQLTRMLEGKGSDALVNRIAQYREKYPSTFPDPNVQARLKEGLHLK